MNKPGSAGIWLALPVAAFLALAPIPVLAGEQPAFSLPANESFAVHAQFTYIEQESSDFNAPYSGPNSLSPDRGAETTDATLYLGKRLWAGAEVWINGEIDQGFGLDDTLGVAGFPSGEAYKSARISLTCACRVLFVRQTLDLRWRLADGRACSESTAAVLTAKTAW